MTLIKKVFAILPLAALLVAPVGAQTTGTINVDGETNVETGLEGGAESESSVDVELGTDSLGGTISSSAQVATDADLEIFSANVATQNENVARVDIVADEVKVVYRHKGRLFGFIPVTVKSTTSVEFQADAEAEINSRLSWWSFMVAGKNYSRTEVESRIENNATIMANAQADTSASARASVAEAMIAELEAAAAASGSAN